MQKTCTGAILVGAEKIFNQKQLKLKVWHSYRKKQLKSHFRDPKKRFFKFCIFRSVSTCSIYIPTANFSLVRPNFRTPYCSCQWKRGPISDEPVLKYRVVWRGIKRIFVELLFIFKVLQHCNVSQLSYKSEITEILKIRSFFCLFFNNFVSILVRVH